MNSDFNEQDLEEAMGEMSSEYSSDGGGFNGFNGFNNRFSGKDREKDVKSINDRTGKNNEIRRTDEDYGKTSSKQKKQ